jgi:hypothetical protein
MAAESAADDDLISRDNTFLDRDTQFPEAVSVAPSAVEVVYAKLDCKANQVASLFV